MKRIAIDMDGVLADVYAQFITMHEKDTGVLLTREEVYGKTEAGAFPNILNYVNAHGFFRNAPLIKDGARVVELLMQQYDVFIVSAAMEFPNSLREKFDWLKEHLPFIGWEQIVLCGSKQVIQADIMIDDHYKNLDYFKGEQGILFTQPHNIYGPDKHFKRVHTWNDVEKFLL